MKLLRLYSSIAIAALICHACKGTYECYGNNSSSFVVCYKGEDTIKYQALGLVGQSIEAKEYYESNGYICIEISSGNAAPTPYLKNSFSNKEVKELEEMGYRCEQTGL